MSAYWWETPEDEPDPDWLEHVEHAEQEEQDRLIRHGDSFIGCVICHNRSAQSIYGMKCASCFEQQREEREAA